MRRDEMTALIARDWERICTSWIAMIRTKAQLKRLAALPDERLFAIARRVYPLVAKWLVEESTKNEVGAFFSSWGKSMFADRFPLSEASYALYLAKNALWDHLQAEDTEPGSVDLYLAIETTQKLFDFFFSASFYLIKGYLEDLYVGLETAGVPEKTLKDCFQEDFFFKSAAFPASYFG
jgi:hypothetical protein